MRNGCGWPLTFGRVAGLACVNRSCEALRGSAGWEVGGRVASSTCVGAGGACLCVGEFGLRLRPGGVKRKYT
jgi:hypothetical protein